MSNNSIAALLAQAGAQLERKNIDTARLDASVLLAHVLGCSREQVLVNADHLLDNKQIFEYQALVERRGKNEPLAYIIGRKEFWSLDFSVTCDTLIPRPETETLVEAALKRVRSLENWRRVSQGQAGTITLLDIGTGSGCLIVTLLTELPDAWGVGVDNSKRALQVAKANAVRHGVESRVQFIESHWCDALDRTFDLIVSNPPYIAEGAMAALMPDVTHYEPRSALVAGQDGLECYRALSAELPRLLTSGGYGLFEVGEGQSRAVEALLREQGLTIETTEKDLAGIDRCVIARKE